MAPTSSMERAPGPAGKEGTWVRKPDGTEQACHPRTGPSAARGASRYGRPARQRVWVPKSQSGGCARASSVRGGRGASGHGGSRAAWQLRLCQLPRRRTLARARKARLICSGVASCLNCLMGVQLGFMGVQLGGMGHLGWFAGVTAAVREIPGSSGRLSLCLPDDGVLRCGCRRPVLACSSIPADRGHRFRRSGARTGHAAKVAPPLFACGMPARAALAVVAWAGDRSPFR